MKDLQTRLIPPLNLKIYLRCVKDPNCIKEDYPRDDTIALGYLSKYINNKFDKSRKRTVLDKPVESFSLQTRPRAKYYRVIRARSMSMIMKLDLFESWKNIDKDKQQK